MSKRRTLKRTNGNTLMPYFLHLYAGRRRVEVHVAWVTAKEASEVRALIRGDRRAELRDVGDERQFVEDTEREPRKRPPGPTALVEWWMLSKVAVYETRSAVALACRLGGWLAQTSAIPSAIRLAGSDG